MSWRPIKSRLQTWVELGINFVVKGGSKIMLLSFEGCWYIANRGKHNRVLLDRLRSKRVIAVINNEIIFWIISDDERYFLICFIVIVYTFKDFGSIHNRSIFDGRVGLGLGLDQVSQVEPNWISERNQVGWRLGHINLYIYNNFDWIIGDLIRSD
jgi:hypothetical protein